MKFLEMRRQFIKSQDSRHSDIQLGSSQLAGGSILRLVTGDLGEILMYFLTVSLVFILVCYK